MRDRRASLILIFCCIMGAFPNIELVRGRVTFWNGPPDAITEPTTVIIVSPKENRTYATNNVTLTVNVATERVYNDIGANINYIRSVYYKADWLEKGEQIFYHLAAYEGKTYLVPNKISITLNLIGIPEGNHNITVYASTSYNLDGSSRVNFTIDTHLQEYVIPEFPSWIILPLFLVATLFSIIIKKKLFQQRSKEWHSCSSLPINVSARAKLRNMRA